MIEITVGTRRFTGWKSSTVTRGIDRMVPSVQLTVTDKPWRIRPGEPCRVTEGGDTLLTGWLDEEQPSYDAAATTLIIAGRGRTGDLADCMSENVTGQVGQFEGLRLEQIAAALCKPFGIPVRADTATGDRFAKVTIDQGETVHDTIEELCRQRGVLAVEDRAGGLRLIRAGTAFAADDLVYGGNVLSASGRFSMAGRYSRYTLKAQRQGSDLVDPKSAAGVAARVEDPGVGRYRPYVGVATSPLSPAEAQAQIAHERNARFGHAARLTYTVAGARQSNGALWEPNFRVRMRDPVMWPFESGPVVGLIERVALAGSGENTITSLTVVRPEAYDLIPEKAVKGRDYWADLKRPLPGGADDEDG